MIVTGSGSMRRVESIMGTTVSIDIRPPHVEPAVLDEVVEQLRDVDARFSMYRPDSEVSRLARGEISLESCSLDVRHVMAACDHLETVTNGAFDARRYRADGLLDPSGFVTPKNDSALHSMGGGWPKVVQSIGRIAGELH